MRRPWLVALVLLTSCGRPASPSTASPAGDEATGQAAAQAESPPAEGAAAASLDVYSEVADKIRAASKSSSEAHDLLRTLCLDIGARPAGSKALSRALDWAVLELKKAGHENVAIEPVTVPHWERGRESATLLGPKTPLSILGLGGSVPTGRGGLTAEVVSITSWDELETKAKDIEGRIVFFDVKMKLDANGFPNYGQLVGYRRAGPSRVAAMGAQGVLIRSLTTDASSPPHTGAVDYDSKAPKIPAAALSWKSADALAEALTQGPAKVRLQMRSTDHGTAQSGNVVAELRGRTKPEEVVVVGGHIDAWDVGHGAHDNGSGVVTSIAALNLLRRLDLRPRRTIRVVLWTDEERNETGAAAYAQAHANETHVAALESDSGAAPIAMLSMQTPGMKMGPPGSIPPPQGFETMEALVRLLNPDGVRMALPFFAGADVQPLVANGTPGVGLFHEVAHYFDVHHSANDVFDSVDPAALQQSVTTTAIVAYVLADVETPLSG